MEIQNENKLGINPTDPWVIGIGALFLGFAIGSRRWSWLRKGFSQLGESVGSLTLTYFYDSIKQQNPKLFKDLESRTTH